MASVCRATGMANISIMCVCVCLYFHACGNMCLQLLLDFHAVTLLRGIESRIQSLSGL